MRTTLDIDEDILRTAKAIAKDSDQSLGRVLSDLARRGLNAPPVEYVELRNGMPLLPRRADAKTVTLEMVKELELLDG